MTRIALLLAAGLLLAGPVAADTRYLQGLGDFEYWPIESDIVGRGYHIYVLTPPGYDAAPDELYPTVYLLDGGNLFPMLAAYSGYLHAGGEIPAVIIVGISYGSDTFEGGNYRSTDFTAASDQRDYWGGAADFQRFLADELAPAIEMRYRAREDRRIVFGQSLGGQFVLYSALTRPDLFWGRIASNPALHRNLEFFLEAHWAADREFAGSKLFVASGSDDAPRFRQPAVEWIEHWQSVDDRPWAFEAQTLESHSHMSAPPAAFRDGMRWLFDGQD